MNLVNSPLADTLRSLVVFIDKVLVPAIFALAFLVFIWGIFMYFIAGAANEEKRETGKKFVIYAIIGFFLMISLWGIVNLLMSSLGFSAGSAPRLPVFDSKNASQQTSGGSNTNTQTGGGTLKGNGEVCTADSECAVGICDHGGCPAFASDTVKCCFDI